MWPFGKRREEKSAAEVEFLVEELGLQSGQTVLDLPCGHGRHSIEFARRGLRVVGVDLNEEPLEKAYWAAREAGVKVDLRRVDMSADIPATGTADPPIPATSSAAENAQAFVKPAAASVPRPLTTPPITSTPRAPSRSTSIPAGMSAIAEPRLTAAYTAPKPATPTSSRSRIWRAMAGSPSEISE